MAITFVAAGTRSKVGSGNMTPGLPSGWAADDIHLLMVTTENGSTVAATGWTQVGTVTSGSCRFTLLWRRAVAGDSGPTVTGNTAGAIAGIVGFRGCTTSGNPWGTALSSNTAQNTATITATGITPNASTDMVVFIGGSVPQYNSSTHSGYSGTNPTFTEGVDDCGTLGTNYQAIYCAYGISTSGSATGNRTATSSQTNGNDHGVFLLSLQEASSGASVTPGAGALSVTGQAPTITTQRSAAPSAGALAITGYAPSVSLGTSISVGIGALSVTGYAPTVTRQIVAAPSVGALSIAGATPTITQQISVASDIAALVLSGQAPTVQVTEAGGVSPGAGALAITGYAPTVTQQISVQTTSGALILTGAAPTATTDAVVSPGVGALTLGGLAPTLTQAIVVTPQTGELTLAGYAPTADLPDKTVTTDVAALIITGYAPTVEGGTPVGRADSGAGKAKRTRRRLQVEIDGEVYDVDNEAEARELIETLTEKAKAEAELALSRAVKAQKRPVRKVLSDARKALEVPEVKAPEELKPIVDDLLAKVREVYESTYRSIQLEMELRRQDQDEQDIEDLLTLL